MKIKIIYFMTNKLYKQTAKLNVTDRKCFINKSKADYEEIAHFIVNHDSVDNPTWKNSKFKQVS